MLETIRSLVLVFSLALAAREEKSAPCGRPHGRRQAGPEPRKPLELNVIDPRDTRPLLCE